VLSKRWREEEAASGSRREKYENEKNPRVHVYIYRRTIWAGLGLTCFIEADLLEVRSENTSHF